METTISLPFTVTSYGSVASTTDQAKIWSDRVRAVIGTNLRERLMNPEFGTLVPEAFMQTADDAEALVVTEVQRAFPTQLPLLTLNSVEASFDEYYSTLSVTILYSLPNDVEVSTTVGLVNIQGTTPPIQENI